jgi:hypothetical protein
MTVSELRRHALANSLKFLSRVGYAATRSNLGSLKRFPRTIKAQAIRAILLASATAATLIGRRSMIRASQSRFVPRCRAYRMTAIDPATSSHPNSAARCPFYLQ